MNMTRIEKLNSHNLSYRFGGIVDIIENRNRVKVSADEIEQLKNLKKDERVIAGRRISTYARTALFLLGVQQDLEGDEAAERLISVM